MEGPGIERAGCHGIGDLGYPVAVVGVAGEVVHQPEAGVGFSLAL